MSPHGRSLLAERARPGGEARCRTDSARGRGAARAASSASQAGELDRAKRWVAAFYERAYSERDKNESSSFAQEYLNYFLEDEPSPGHRLRTSWCERLLPRVTPRRLTTLDAARGSKATARWVLPPCCRRSRVFPVPARRWSSRSALASAEKGRGHAVDRRRGNEARGWSTSPRRPRSARERQVAELGMTVVTIRERSRSVAETDRLQEQSGALHDVHAGRRGAGRAATSSSQARFAPQYVELSGSRRFQGASRSAETPRGQARVRVAVHLALDAWRVEDRQSPADLETALQLLLHRGITRHRATSGCVRADEKAARAAVANRGRSPGQEYSARRSRR